MTTTTDATGDPPRRDQVLDAALGTFARYGYRRTSMDLVARGARISRPGLYFLFSSKLALFRETVDRAVTLDLAAAERALTASGRPLADRLLDAFDAWAGRYVGPLGDVPALIDGNPDILGPIVTTGPDRFAAALRSALADGSIADPGPASRTLISVSIGVKHQTDDRDRYRRRMREAVRLIVRER